MLLRVHLVRLVQIDKLCNPISTNYQLYFVGISNILHRYCANGTKHGACISIWLLFRLRIHT